MSEQTPKDRHSGDRRSGVDRRVSIDNLRDEYAERRQSQGRRAAGRRWHPTPATTAESETRVVSVKVDNVTYDHLCRCALTARVPVRSVMRYLLNRYAHEIDPV